MYIWLGSQVDPTFVQSLFGPQSLSQVPLDKVESFDTGHLSCNDSATGSFSVVSLNWIIRYQRMSAPYWK